MRLPAWLLSLALHLAALLLGTLLIRGTYQPPPEEEPVRTTSIVLAQATPTAATEYFDQDELRGETAEHRRDDSAVPSATDELLESGPPADALIELPRPAAASIDAPGLSLPTTKRGTGASRMSGLTPADVAAILAEEAARPRAAGPTGPTARLSLFGSAEAEGRSFVFLIDRSQSMGHQGLGAIAAAAKELAGSIDRLDERHSFQVIAYNQKPLALGGREMLQATAENKQRLIDFVANTAAFGATEHELGLFAALRFKPGVIFLLTDGGDPGLKPGQLRAISQAAAESRTAIHCLHFGAGPLSDEENFLERLAAQNRGSYVYVDMQTK